MQLHKNHKDYNDWKDDGDMVKLLEYLEKVTLSNEGVEHSALTAVTSQHCLNTFHQKTETRLLNLVLQYT